MSDDLLYHIGQRLQAEFEAQLMEDWRQSLGWNEQRPQSLNLRDLELTVNEWDRRISINIPNVQMIIESHAMVEAYWLRLPRSKKHRVRKKWKKLYAQKYLRHKPRKNVLVAQGKVIAHPQTARELRRNFPKNLCVFQRLRIR